MDSQARKNLLLIALVALACLTIGVGGGALLVYSQLHESQPEEIAAVPEPQTEANEFDPVVAAEVVAMVDDIRHPGDMDAVEGFLRESDDWELQPAREYLPRHRRYTHTAGITADFDGSGFVAFRWRAGATEAERAAEAIYQAAAAIAANPSKTEANAASIAEWLRDGHEEDLFLIGGVIGLDEEDGTVTVSLLAY